MFLFFYPYYINEHNNNNTGVIIINRDCPDTIHVSNEHQCYLYSVFTEEIKCEHTGLTYCVIRKNNRFSYCATLKNGQSYLVILEWICVRKKRRTS